MKFFKVIALCLFLLMPLSSAIYAYDDPLSPTYMGYAKYHCYYVTTNTMKYHEAVDFEEKVAKKMAKTLCEMKTPGQCVFYDCIQK